MSKKPDILPSFHFFPLKRLYVVVILSRFLGLLQLLEEVAEFADFLTSPIGSTVIFCMLSYQVFVLMGCNIPSSAILSSTVALALHCMIDRR